MLSPHYQNFLAIVVLTITAPSLRPAKAADAPQLAEAEEYAVYSVVINDFYVRQEKSLTIVKDYLAANPANDSHYLYALAHHPEINPRLRLDYETKNLAAYSFESHFRLTMPYTLGPTKECQELWRKGEQKVFETKCSHQGRMIMLSRVGFDVEKKEALVQVSIPCHELLCGEGAVILLAKDGGVWKIKDLLMIWES